MESEAIVAVRLGIQSGQTHCEGCNMALDDGNGTCAIGYTPNKDAGDAGYWQQRDPECIAAEVDNG